MNKKQQDMDSKISIFPDTISDDHTSRIFLALILFSTFLIVFDYQEMKSSKEVFFSKYGIQSVNETPEAFKELERQEQQSSGVKYNGKLKKYGQQDPDQQDPNQQDPDQQDPDQQDQEDQQMTEEELQEYYEQYKDEKNYFQYFLYYYIADCVCVALQYIFGSVSTYQNYGRLWLAALTVIVFSGCGAYQIYKFIYFDYYQEYIIFKFIVQIIILVYALFLFIKKYLQIKNKYDFGDFYKNHQIVCYEYTFQKLFKRVSKTWDSYQNKEVSHIEIEMYLKQKINKAEKQDIIENNDYLKYSFFQILKSIVTPFSMISKRRVIGDFVYYPIKYLSALLLAIFIYVYLLNIFIEMAKYLKELAQSYRQQLEQVPGSEPLIDIALIDAAQAAFYVTIVFEFIILIFYSFYLSHRYKKETIRIRRGMKKFNINPDPYATIKFYAFYCGNFLIAFVILTIVITIFFTCIIYRPFWGLVWSLIKQHYWAILTLVFNIVAFKILRIFTMDGLYVKRKRLLMAGDIFYVITGIPSVVTRGVIRVFMGILGNLIHIFRIDKPIISGKLAMFDTAYTTFIGMIFMNHYQNNPVVLTFLDLLEACAKQNKKHIVNSNKEVVKIEPTETNVEQQDLNDSMMELQRQNSRNSNKDIDNDKEILAKKKRIINRFHLCVLLAKNPSLCMYRKAEDNDKRLFQTNLEKLKDQDIAKKQEDKE